MYSIKMFCLSFVSRYVNNNEIPKFKMQTNFGGNEAPGTQTNEASLWNVNIHGQYYNNKPPPTYMYVNMHLIIYSRPP